MAITKLTAATRKEVESRSPKALPNRPGDKGWDGDQVRKYLYWAIMMVYDLLAEHIDEVATIIDDPTTGLDAKVTALLSYFNENGVAKKAYADEDGNRIKEFYAKLASNNTLSGQNEFTGRAIFSGYANLYNSYLDTNNKDYFVRVGVTNNQRVTYKLPYNYSDKGNVSFTLATTSYVTEQIAADNATKHQFKTDSEGYIYQIFPEGSDETVSESRVANHQDALNMVSELEQLKNVLASMLGLKTDELEIIEKIIAGHLQVGHSNEANNAHADMEGNHINVSNYGKSVTMAYDSTNGKLTVNLFNQNGTKISDYTIDLPSELVFVDEYYDNVNKKLVFVPASGGNNIEISLSDLVDTYTAGTDSDDICQISVNNHAITVSIKDGSISMAKLSSTLQSTWNGWVSAEADRVLAEQGRVSAEQGRVSAENARTARPYLDIDGEGYLIINYGSAHDITID